jgi:bifunctional hydroxylase/dehydrase
MDAEVIVVGAGPTGLTLAGELRLGGVEVLVVERLERPTGQSRGLGFTARAMETLDQRGLLPRFGTVEISPLGHFGGVRFDYTVLPGAHFGARGIPQSQTEAVLEQWAVELGARVRRGWTVLAWNDSGDEVTVEVGTPEGVRSLRADYLVGCDGGASTIREAAGFGFPGSPATRGMYLADVVGADIRPRPLGERLDAGMVMAAPLRAGVDRIIVCEHGVTPQDRTGPVSFAEVAGSWRRITGEDISGATAEWVSSFTDATRQASRYRIGRVLLAGDAAHIHLPAGGQGMSTGILDAVNLGWKLAATVRGWAPDGLLDSYHGERHPAGARLLMNTRAQGQIFLGGPEAQPMRELLAELIVIDDVKRHLAGIVSGLDIRYEMPDGGDHPLVGRRVPPMRLRAAEGQTSTTRLLHPAHGVLLDLTGDQALREVAGRWKDRVLTSTATSPDGEDPGSGEPAAPAALLVRPDGYVAWAGTAPAGLATSLSRWFGAPIGRR